MIPFETLNQYLRWARFLPRDSSRKEKILSIVFNCFYFWSHVVCLLSTSWFFCFTARTYGEYVWCFFFIQCAVLGLFCQVTFFLNKNEYENLSYELHVITINSKFEFFCKQIFKQIILIEKWNKSMTHQMCIFSHFVASFFLNLPYSYSRKNTKFPNKKNMWRTMF